jgi:hypothetical protein
MSKFVLNNVKFTQKSINKLLFSATTNTNYHDLIKFEEKAINRKTHMSSSVVLRSGIEIDLLFNSSKGVDFKFEYSKQYSLVLEATRHCQYTNKVVYILRQINVLNDEPKSVDDEDIVTDEVLCSEDIHEVYDDLLKSINNIVKIKKMEIKKIRQFISENSETNINTINRLSVFLSNT